MILASQSPRRRELLKLITSNFQVIPAFVDETLFLEEPAENYVERLARLKATTVAKYSQYGELVIGVDTIVSVDGMVLNKPSDKMEFLDMMDCLSGGTHQVCSGLSVLRDGRSWLQIVKTNVTFREISMAERLAYWTTGEPLDKAGGYGIQGLAARFVKSINGSYTNVVGLPLVELEAMLNDAS